MGECTRAGFCNFMHLKPISRDLRRELYGRMRGDSKGRRGGGRARRIWSEKGRRIKKRMRRLEGSEIEILQQISSIIIRL